MNLLKIIIGTLESEPSPYYKPRLTDVILRQSQKMSQPVTVIKIRRTWPESYPVRVKKKLQIKYRNPKKTLNLSKLRLTEIYILL